MKLAWFLAPGPKYPFHVCQAPKIASRQLLPLEIIVRGEDRNGMKAKLNHLCQQFDAFEKKAVRWIAIGTSLPGVVVAVIAVMKLGRV